MNEERFAYRIRQALNRGATDLPLSAQRRLEAARHQALSRQKQPSTSLVLAGGPISGNVKGWPFPFARQLLAMLALLLGMWISFYWHSIQYISQLEEIDSALLSDELPPEAFMDRDFLQWLLDDSSDD